MHFMPHRPYIALIAPTPLVPVQLAQDEPLVWCKLDFLNTSGSTKDRIAHILEKDILEKGWRQGGVGPQTIVVEASSGSTSIALSLACAQFGIEFVAVMPEGHAAVVTIFPDRMERYFTTGLFVRSENSFLWR